MDGYGGESDSSGVIDLEAGEWNQVDLTAEEELQGGAGSSSMRGPAFATPPKSKKKRQIGQRSGEGGKEKKGGGKKRAKKEGGDGSVQPDVEVQSDFRSWAHGGAPPTIQFSTAMEMQPPKNWMGKQGAKDAADCRPWMDCARLAGSVDLKFSVQGRLPDAIQQLSTPVYSKRTRVSIGGDAFGIATWNALGEPTSKGTITVGALLDWCKEGKLAPEEGVRETLEAMRELMLPESVETLPWKGQPLIRVICPSLLATHSPDGTLSITGFLYLTRLVFFLIAFPPIQKVMSAITPCVPPRRAKLLPDLGVPVFTSDETDHSAEYRFSLPGVMKSIEHKGYQAAEQPPGLSLAMKDYQLQTLRWMQDREALEHGLNELFWEEWYFQDDLSRPYFFAPGLGELRLERPEQWRGGILSEEMGMGKTIEILALIQSSKLKRERERRERRGGGSSGGCEPGVIGADGVVGSHATLIVVPNHLVSQWASEISRCAPPSEGGLTHMCYIHPKDNIDGKCAPFKGGKPECAEAGQCIGYAAHKMRRIQGLATGADIVLTTYQTLEKQKGTLKTVGWARVVLDEMQEIRSSTTELAKACRGLSSSVRWMVSGTPLYTSIDDLNGELSFLGVLPFCLPDAVDGFWGACISDPWRRQEQIALDRLQTLLKGVMIRHSKSQTYVQGGSSILALPEAHNRIISVDPSPSERYVSAFLEMHAVKELTGIIEGVVSEAGEMVEGWSGRGRGGEMRSKKGAASFWMRVLREASVTPAVINGQMIWLDQRLRSQGVGLVGLLGSAGEEETGEIRSMEPGEAIAFLMQSRDVSETARHHQGNHMVRHDGNEMGIYDRSRNYAMRTVVERLEEVTETRAELQMRVDVAQRNVPLLRWKLALEAISSGRYLDLSRCSTRLMRRAFARLRGAPERALGYRVQFVKAKCDYPDGVDTDTGSGEEMVVGKGGSLAVCATTPQGWEALGFKWDARNLLVAMVGLECDEMHTEGGVTDSKYRLSGRIGTIPKNCVEAKQVPAVPGLLETLKRKIAELISESTIAEAKLREMAPYLAILERAKAAGAGLNASETVDQSGFQQLMEIEQGGSPTCCVCQDGCPLSSRPTFMRCAHFACEDCIVQWVRFEQSKGGGGGASAGGAGGKATCPLCRKQFRLADLIRIIAPTAPPPMPSTASSSLGKKSSANKPSGKGCSSSSSSSSSSRGGSSSAKASSAAVLQPRWSPACTKEALDAMPAPIGGYMTRGTIPGSAAFPSLSPQFGTHMYVVTGGEVLGGRNTGNHVPPASSKVMRLLSDLNAVFARGDKAVVFSQHKNAVTHISRVLVARGVRHARIVRGDPQSLQESAVRDFNTVEDIRVFLLHAGQAAAGLTLTAAAHVFLMEPMLKEGEELQAMNRCHRIGQKNEVTCTIYYTPGSIEERMLAYRDFEAGVEDDPLSVLDHDAEGAILDTPAKLKFLLGLDSLSAAAT